MKLKTVEEVPINSKVILRLDTDLPTKNNQILDNSRLIKSIPTINLLLEKKCKIIILGHKGRPKDNETDLSLKPIYVELMSILENEGSNIIDSVFIDNVKDGEKIKTNLNFNDIVFIENLRFWKEEEENSSQFLENLTKISDCFVNDAFAVAHRKHASIMLWQKLPTYYGLSFAKEVEKIGNIFDTPKRPLTIILGGAKEDKLKYLNDLLKIADHVLIGGKLPKLIFNDQFLISNEKIEIAELNKEGLDLSEKDIEKFKEIILQSKTIIWAGAMGYFESEENRKGTEEIAIAIANTDAYKIIAGGDTGASIISLGLKDKIDFICSGGGVLLEYLSKGSLPAFEE